MIGATYPVLASFTGSEQSLSRSLSPVDRVPAESSPPPVGASRFHSEAATLSFNVPVLPPQSAP